MEREDINDYLLSIGFIKSQQSSELYWYYTMPYFHLSLKEVDIQYNSTNGCMNIFFGNAIQLANIEVKSKEDFEFIISRSQILKKLL